MANGDDIKTKISVDTSEAKKNITSLNAALKTNNSEMKALSAGYDKGGKSVDNLRAKSENLRQKQELQRKKMSELNKLYEAQVKKTGEDSTQAQKLKQQINLLTAEMKDTEKQLGDTNKELKNQVDVQGKLEAAAKGVKVALGAVAIAAAAAVAAVAIAGKALKSAIEGSYNLSNEAAKYWDDVATAARDAQMATADYQAMLYASNFMDFDTTKLINAVRGSKAIVTGEERLAGVQSALDGYGVNFAVNADTWGVEQLIALMSAVSEAGVNEAGQKDIYTALSINEKEWADLFGAFGQEGSASVYTQLANEAEAAGVIINDVQGEALAQLADAQDRLDAIYKGLQNNLGASFSVMFTPIIEDTGSMVGEISKIIQDSFGEDNIDVEAIQAAVQKWLPTIIKDAIPIMDVLTMWLQLFNGILSGSFEGLEDLFDDPEALAQFQESWGNLLTAGGDLFSNVWESTAGLREQISNWAQGVCEQIGEWLWNSFVRMMPDGVRNLLGFQTTDEKEITEEYNDQVKTGLAEAIINGYIGGGHSDAEILQAKIQQLGLGDVGSGNRGGEKASTSYTDNNNVTVTMNNTFNTTDEGIDEIYKKFQELERRLLRAGGGGSATATGGGGRG